MFTLVEALNYRCLRCACQPLGPMHVLVGPGGSGKSSFLDIPAMLADLVAEGPETAVSRRSGSFTHLVFGNTPGSFELAVEARLPDHLEQHREAGFQVIRYEVALRQNQPDQHPVIAAEKVVLKKGATRPDEQLTIFPRAQVPPKSILLRRWDRTTKAVVNKVPDSTDHFYPETSEGFAPSFRLGPSKSALGNLPEDQTNFPAATWLKHLLCTGVQRLALNVDTLRRPAPPARAAEVGLGDNTVPWLIDHLRRDHPNEFQRWLRRLREAVPQVHDVEVVRRPWDGHAYLVLNLRGKVKVPSWLASDGTLRLMALTLPAYLPELGGVLLVEEPENGIHPSALGVLCDALQAARNLQVLAATHSPWVIRQLDPSRVLVFAKTTDGATDIITGKDHPELRSAPSADELAALVLEGKV